MTRKESCHNAHMLVPRSVWDRAKRQAILDGISMTAFVTKALRLLVSIRSKDLEHKVNTLINRKR